MEFQWKSSNWYSFKNNRVVFHIVSSCNGKFSSIKQIVVCLPNGWGAVKRDLLHHSISMWKKFLCDIWFEFIDKTTESRIFIVYNMLYVRSTWYQICWKYSYTMKFRLPHLISESSSQMPHRNFFHMLISGIGLIPNKLWINDKILIFCIYWPINFEENSQFRFDVLIISG